MGLGWRGVTQVLLKDITGAKDSLSRAEHIRRKQAFWPPVYLASSLLAQFMLDLHLLEDAIGGDSRSSISEYSRAALKSGKKAVKNSAKYASHRTWNYQLMGMYYWLIGKQRKALKWFDKSIKEGERLGARPDLSRTYMEVGKRLLEPHSKYKELNGISRSGVPGQGRYAVQGDGFGVGPGATGTRETGHVSSDLDPRAKAAIKGGGLREMCQIRLS